MRTAIINYDAFSQPLFVEKTEFVVFCMTGNTLLPDPPNALADITTKLTAYKAKLYLGQQGNHQAVVEANVLRKEISVLLRANGVYVNETALGDMVILESSGYDISKEREITPKPEFKVYQSSQSGSGRIIIQAVPGAVAYLIEYCTDPVPAPGNTNVWHRLDLTTKSYQTISGVEAGKLCYGRYCTVSVDGESAMSALFEFRLI